MIAVTVNGKTRPVAAGATVTDLLNAMQIVPAGIAVAVNAEVVRRAAWASTTLKDGDRVDVIRAVQGG